MKKLSLAFLLVTLCACSPGGLFSPTHLAPTSAHPANTAAGTASGLPTYVPNATSAPTEFAVAPTATSTPTNNSIWFGNAVPDSLAQKVLAAGFVLSADKSSASATLDVAKDAGASWIYALVAPFPTVTDDVPFADIQSSWKGAQAGPFAGRAMWMSDSTLAALTSLWGEPASGAVQTAPADKLLDAAWANRPAWAIVPFEDVEPRWKVLSVDSESPIRKGFDATVYPLKVNFVLKASGASSVTFDLPSTNRDASKLTTVILTGVTALVRATAKTMDVKGIDYPGEAVRDVFREADILHINNEVPFYGGCPDPNPKQSSLVFCSATRYIDLFTYVGADVVELSGDHFANYGAEAMRQTMQIYKDNGFKTYGGGLNVFDGRAPLLMEVNGNKLMFIGCNIKTIYATATETNPGSVPCDFDYSTAQIKQYRAQGYLPIATFQYHEYPDPATRPQQAIDFHRMADAGAVIVSGSQAHLPQGMEFYNGAFIHYGLGNLFFDQMVDINRLEFIDRHVFYDGKYLGVELLTALLEDYSQPNWMSAERRLKLLNDYFQISGW